MPIVETEKRSIQPCKLAFRDRHGDSGTIVLLHGAGFSKEVFDEQFNSAALKNYRLIAIDLPGHGASDNAQDAIATYCFEGFALAIESLLRQLNVEKCIVVGWSLGGHIALQMAGRCPLVDGVLTMGAAPVSGGPLGLIRSMHFTRGLLLAGKAQFSAADAALFETYCMDDKANGRFVSTLVRTDALMRPSLARSTLMRFGPGQYGEMMNSEVDICLIHGSRDPFIRTNYMNALKAPSLFRGGAIVFEKSGHAPFCDEPAKFEATLIDFFVSVQARASSRGKVSFAA